MCNQLESSASIQVQIKREYHLFLEHSHVMLQKREKPSYGFA